MASLLHQNTPEIPITVDVNALPYNQVDETFTYKLPANIYIDVNDQWSFYVHSFVFPAHFHNLQECTMTLGNNTLPPDNHYKIALPSQQCVTSPALLCNLLNAELVKPAVREFCNSGGRKPFTFSLPDTGITAGRVKVDPRVTNVNDDNVISLIMSQSLFRKLGFESDNVLFDVISRNAEQKINLNFGQEMLLLYANVIQNRVYNDRLCKLVDVFPFRLSERTTGSSAWPYYQNPIRYKYGGGGNLCHKVISPLINEVSFQIKHENGKTVKWASDGPCLLTFCFKRTPCFV